MAKCNLGGCEEKAIGGFQELLDASSFDFPNATIKGSQTAWCKSHEAMLRPTVIGVRGKQLTAKELT
jgi:hypothetical protein